MTAGGQTRIGRFHVELSFYGFRDQGSSSALGVRRSPVERGTEQNAVAAALFRSVKAGIG